MDRTRAPVPAGQKRLGGHNSIAARRPARPVTLRALLFCSVATALVVVSPAQLSPANLLEDQLDGRSSREVQAVAAEPEPKAKAKGKSKPDVWASATLGTTGAGKPRKGRPAPAISRYIKTTNPTKLARLGCGQGKRLRVARDPRGHIVVLAFGRPTQKGKGRGHHWGASLFRRGFHSTSEIQRAAQAYAQAAWHCMHGEKASTRLTVGIGTSNFGRGVSFSHGRAWAQMVNAANDWSAKNGYSDRIRFAGANDIELSWAGPRQTRAWVRGYDSVAEWPYYDFGDAAACPPRGSCHGPWTMEDVWYVAWGARSARPLPEIYNPSGIMAEQWYRLSLYSFKKHGMRMWIAGVMSQRTACRQSRDPCRGMNNSPAKAWHQLDRWLNRDHRTAQPLHWSTDIAWTR